MSDKDFSTILQTSYVLSGSSLVFALLVFESIPIINIFAVLYLVLSGIVLVTSD